MAVVKLLQNINRQGKLKASFEPFPDKTNFLIKAALSFQLLLLKSMHVPFYSQQNPAVELHCDTFLCPFVGILNSIIASNGTINKRLKQKQKQKEFRN